MRRPVALMALLLAAVAAPASAQAPPAVSLRPFLAGTGERFAAHETFDAVFGQAVQPMWGGGLQVAFRKGFYFDITASRFKKKGERAFFFEGEGFGLDIPLTVTLTAVEVTAGARFGLTPRVIPYIGGGVGSYRYREKEEDSTDGQEPFEAHHVGYLAVGGIEFRISRWIALTGDAQYTHVPGIIGEGGISKEAGESDLGGIAARFRVIIGR